MIEATEIWIETEYNIINQIMVPAQNVIWFSLKYSREDHVDKV